MDSYDYQNSMGFIINSAAKMFVKSLDSELRKKLGVTFSQWKVLVMLSIKDGLTQTEIANGLGLEGATLIPILDKMEKNGLVVRKVDQADRRNNRIYHTQKAENMWVAMIDCALKIREISIKDITPSNIAVTRHSLEKIYRNLETYLDASYSSSPAAASIIPPKEVTSTNSTNQEN